MGMHYSNPSDRPRVCPRVWVANELGHITSNPTHPSDCECKGTGKLGNPEARPDIATDCRSGLWFYGLRQDGFAPQGPYIAESTALVAARLALKDSGGGDDTGSEDDEFGKLIYGL